MEITIGFTESDRASNYIPMMDGYRPGAAQTVVTVTLPAEAAALNLPAERWAEAAFVATNAPDESCHDAPAALLYAALQGHPFRAVSVGDTVSVAGTRYVCERIGWTTSGTGFDADTSKNHRPIT